MLSFVRRTKNRGRILTGLLAAAAIGAVVTLPRASFASELRLPAGPYNYIVIDQELRDALIEFGRNVGVPIEVSDQIKGRLRGRVTVSTAEQFMKLVSDSYGLVWYYDGAVLHVSAENEVRTETLITGTVTAAALTQSLDRLGFSDQRFAIRSASNGVISASGPPAYIALVRQTIATITKSEEPRTAREVPLNDSPKVRVFRGGGAT
jgi:type II secretory pathway component GspD/PulD (secretin)